MVDSLQWAELVGPELVLDLGVREGTDPRTAGRASEVVVLRLGRPQERVEVRRMEEERAELPSQLV